VFIFWAHPFDLDFVSTLVAQAKCAAESSSVKAQKDSSREFPNTTHLSIKQRLFHVIPSPDAEQLCYHCNEKRKAHWVT
jgi:hypothetical protein